MYINLMGTIITSVNHRIEARASISTNELDPLLLFEARRVFEPGFYRYIHSPHRTDDNIMYQPFSRYFVQYARTPTLRYISKWTDVYHFKLQHTWFCQHCLWTAPVGLMSLKIAQTLIRRFFVRIFIRKLNCCKFEPSYFCFLPVSSGRG